MPLKPTQTDGSALVATPTGTVRINPTVLATGDVCDVYEGTLDGTTPCLVKVNRETDFERLVARELDVLSYFREISKDPKWEFFRHTLPEPLSGYFEVETDEGLRWAFCVRPEEGMTAKYLRDTHYPEGIPPIQVAWMLTRLLSTLASAHRHGWCHGSVMPQNLLVRWDNDKGHRWLKVLGWGTAVEIGKPFEDVFLDSIPFYPPEAFKKEACTPASDIFMFGQTANWLLGGDLRSRKIPKHVPAPLRGALQSCLIPSLHRRPSDASKLLLEVLRPAMIRTWGPPKYVAFNPPPEPPLN